ncbi:MAG: peptidoglycan DD-metalloendopeptidase family protein [Actinomycetia bacterium]|nr:peptidoglycan DD-metalloendopeptidase family protein [Actinomycetes bacterium]
MSTITRRFAPTIAAALTLAALTLPVNVPAATAQPALTIFSVSDATTRLSSAEASLTTAGARVANLQADIAELSLAISHAEALQPQTPVDGLVQVLKAYAAPFSDSLMADTEKTLDAGLQLDSLRDRRTEATATLDVAAAEAHARSEAVNAAIADLQTAKQIEAERVGAEKAAKAAQRAALAAKVGILPVAGPNSYIDSWGFARSGGRQHKGTDIMAKRGTPVVAVKDGVVRVSTNSLGGLCVYLTADDGTEYYYAHLDTVVRSSGRVDAGQKIATVGNSGNAAGGPTHVHFEVHPGGGSPVDPYPILQKMVV